MGDGSSIREKLEAARRELLDLSLRNRLLNTPRRRTRTSSLEVVDELSEQLFQVLVVDGKSMSFLPQPEEPADEDGPDAESDAAVEPAPPGEPEQADDDGDGRARADRATPETDDGPRADDPLVDLAQPDDADPVGAEPDDTADGDEVAIAARHADRRLQTALESPVLQGRLLRLYYDQRTYEEEQGVNVLFLALGFLEWYEDGAPDTPRYAPLILVPVRLERRSATSRFRVSWSGEDITTNLSLQVKLRAELGIDLPDVPADADELSPDAYFDDVRAAVAARPRWQVRDNDVVLWFFAFTKLLMYLDLDPDRWPSAAPLERRPLIGKLLGGSAGADPRTRDADDPDGADAEEADARRTDDSADEPASGTPSDAAPIDDRPDALDTVHVLDADSSQSLAIEEVRRGGNLVIQGPPGTGKSQTIANAIAAAVKDGRRVLFVAEKRAALDVVKRRLANIGLGEMCLELHSNKARKKDVLAELERTLALAPPLVDDIERNAHELDDARRRLDAHADRLHARHQPAGRSPFEVIGELVRLRDAGAPVDEIDLPGALSWSPADVSRKAGALAELAEQIERLGCAPADHVWRGVNERSLLPTDRDRLSAQLPQAVDALARARDLAARLGAAVGRAVPDAHDGPSPDGARALIALARRIAAAPPLDRDAHAGGAWTAERERIGRLVETGRRYDERRAALADAVVASAWDVDAGPARRAIAAHGGSIFRIFVGDYRSAMATLRSICAGAPPRGLDARLRLLDALSDGKAARDAIGLDDELGRRAFGSRWAGPASDWSALAAIERWDAECAADPLVGDGFRRTLPGAAPAPELLDGAERLEAALAEVDAAVEPVFEKLALDASVAFGAERWQLVAFDVLRARLDAWRAGTEALASWNAYAIRDAAARGEGLGDLCDLASAGTLPPGALVDTFSVAYHEDLLRRMIQLDPELARFDGLAHEQLRRRFQELDRRHIELTRQRVAAAHYERIPRGAGEIGQLGILRREMKKRRRHLPIRQLLKQAGDVITRIKPVCMMSPISVAQFLEPGDLEFDLLLIDEASQVQPVDALGAIARAGQIVVVGDDKQLPPTRFFSKSLDDVDPDDDLVERTGDLESILGLCEVQGIASRMLRWHYRSRHHSLIAVSNEEFYDGRLYVVPSPFYAVGAYGLRYHRVRDGVYDRGGSRTNRPEAAAVAAAVMRHAAEHPGVSLGVGAFSVAQRDAIIDELERLRRASPAHEAFFATDGAEPFFVKNLENIQGDERDVIYISVGYGPDEAGHLTMSFGPVSAEGGERRLNVLITRARVRCEVFSTIGHDDIDERRATGRGPRALKTFLRHAETGEHGPRAIGPRRPDSVFECELAEAVADGGVEVDPRIGAGGFCVDLALRHPERPGRYVLGVECDGPSYHAARSARDRDRIRESVLESRGWRIHRVWTTDWFRQPETQRENALAMIAQAVEAPGPEALAAPTGGGGGGDAAVRRAGEAEGDEAGGSTEYDFVVPYEEADVKVPGDTELHEADPERLAAIVARVAEVEGPVHRDEIVRRITTLWGLARAGGRIRAVLGDAIDAALADGRLVGDDGFVRPAGAAAPPVRDRANVTSTSLRRAEMLPPSEIRRCLLALVRDHVGVTRDQATISAARCFGYRSTSAQLRAAIEARIEGLLRSGELVERDRHLFAPTDVADAGAPADG